MSRGATFCEKEKQKVAGLIGRENILLDLIPFKAEADVMATAPDRSISRYLALLRVILF